VENSTVVFLGNLKKIISGIRIVFRIPIIIGTAYPLYLFLAKEARKRIPLLSGLGLLGF